MWKGWVELINIRQVKERMFEGSRGVKGRGVINKLMYSARISKASSKDGKASKKEGVLVSVL
jgi:hypothetical protein